ncbi:MAG: hypothetical protein IJ109_05955 [Firmicutes bacterium]|nr:hypothetical protein [Bacillota bacterium]
MLLTTEQFPINPKGTSISKVTKGKKKLKAKKKYYVQIRTYRKVGGQYYYSAWSKTRKIKTR